LDLGLAHFHDRALAELLFDLGQGGGERLALVVVHRIHSIGFNQAYVAHRGLSRGAPPQGEE
jgi:hypothetical protein